jgi:predicted HTH transcriptional regulator
MAAVETVPRIAALMKGEREQKIIVLRAEITAAKAEVKTMEETLRALQGHGAPATTTTRTRAGNGARTATRKRPAAAGKPVAESMVLDAVNRGFDTSTKLAEELNASPETIRRRLHALLAGGSIKRQGAGADSRWLPIGGP